MTERGCRLLYNGEDVFPLSTRQVQLQGDEAVHEGIGTFRAGIYPEGIHGSATVLAIVGDVPGLDNRQTSFLRTLEGCCYELLAAAQVDQVQSPTIARTVMFWRLMDPLRIDPPTKRLDPRVNRVVALELHLTRRQWKPILPIIQQATPSLRHLVISASGYIPNPELTFHDLSLDNGQLHMVTHDMSTCLPWDCLPPLTHGLREWKLSVYKSSADSLRRLCDFLEAFPVLEHLDLYMSATHFHSRLQSTPTEAVDAPPTLMMPRLVKLTLYNGNDAYITHHLVTPRLRQCF
ncbi:hypothetical protein JB92DRAFT_2828279 [Gautieria morchelliformis]|nr:hypothetical protein JB92DRAFT_2828279 [Gautieria morchelliformis]